MARVLIFDRSVQGRSAVLNVSIYGPSVWPEFQFSTAEKRKIDALHSGMKTSPLMKSKKEKTLHFGSGLLKCRLLHVNSR